MNAPASDKLALVQLHAGGGFLQNWRPQAQNPWVLPFFRARIHAEPASDSYFNTISDEPAGPYT